MGAGSFKGVEARGGSIRITFTFNGERRRETLKTSPTPNNLKQAARLRDEILDKINKGNFVYYDYFPNSDFFKTHPEALPEESIIYSGDVVTFGEVAQRWFDTLSVEEGTRRKYKGDLNSTWMPKFADRDIRSIRYSELKIAVNELQVGNKTKNNMLTSLRGVFNLAFKDEIISKDPTEPIDNSKVLQDDPDPFDDDEVKLILEWFRAKRTGELSQVLNYFGAAFYTGMRPEEQIAIRWADFDERKGTLKVHRAMSYGVEKGTKTNKARIINLTSEAMHYVLAQKPYSFMKCEHIFLNPNTGNPWADQAKQRNKHWIPALKALGIRYRVPYNTRHTYATMMLMASCNPAYAAKQMGHSLSVFFNKYARWINGKTDEIEHSKLSDFLSKTPSLPQGTKKQA